MVANALYCGRVPIGSSDDMNDIVVPIKCSTLARLYRGLEKLIFIECAAITIVGIPFVIRVGIQPEIHALDVTTQLYFGIWMLATTMTLIVSGYIIHDNFPQIKCIEDD